jgi:hypothetical protein
MKDIVRLWLKKRNNPVAGSVPATHSSRYYKFLWDIQRSLRKTAMLGKDLLSREI